MALYRFDGWVKSALGPALAGVDVYVCLQPANIPTGLSSATPTPTPLAPVFADVNGLVPIVQPLQTDGFGHYSCYAANGVRYTISVYNSNTLQNSYVDQVPMGASV